jgi:ribosome-associated protein
VPSCGSTWRRRPRSPTISQARNRALAEQRLVERLRAALHVPRQRRPTRPTRSAVDRRITGKKRRAETKETRRRPSADD